MFKSISKHRYSLLGTLLAFSNLYLAYLFRFDLIPLKLPYTVIESILYLENPVYNFGGFFVDGTKPTIFRLPTIFILLYVSLNLYKYLLKPHTKSQTIFAIILLGGLGGLTLDILAYGSVCDWLGFMIPGGRYYSLLNISDLMILVSAPFAAIICIPNIILKIVAFVFSILVIGANSYYHFIALYNLII